MIIITRSTTSWACLLTCTIIRTELLWKEKEGAMIDRCQNGSMALQYMAPKVGSPLDRVLWLLDVHSRAGTVEMTEREVEEIPEAVHGCAPVQHSISGHFFSLLYSTLSILEHYNSLVIIIICTALLGIYIKAQYNERKSKGKQNIK